MASALAEFTECTDYICLSKKSITNGEIYASLESASGTTAGLTMAMRPPVSTSNAGGKLVVASFKKGLRVTSTVSGFTFPALVVAVFDGTGAE